MNQDYGMYLLDHGAQKDLVLHFADIPLDHITLVSPDLFTSVINKVLDGKELCVSIDFKTPLMEDIGRLASQEVSLQLLSGVDAMDTYPWTIDFSMPLVLSLEAHFGDKVRIEDEVFLPLVVDRIYRPSLRGD